MNIQQIQDALLAYEGELPPRYMYLHPNSWTEVLVKTRDESYLYELLGLEIITTITCPRTEVILTHEPLRIREV